MSEEKPKIRLRPVVYTTNTFKRGAQNTTQQMFLLEALKVTRDPNKLKEMIGVKTVAEVYRTLDKLSMRKEYHEALARSGISFDYIVKGLKSIADYGFKDADKLKALQTLLKSVGMEKYDDLGPSSTGTWEEALLQKIEEGKVNPDAPKLEGPKPYAVTEPQIPESVRLAQEAEDEVMGKSVYDSKPEKDEK